jgi:GNAT superfamily N-acetyltransferase
VEIRRFDEDIGEGAAELFRELQPSVLTTAAYLMHRQRTAPARTRRLSLVAVDADSVVGWGSVTRPWPEAELDRAAIWVMVKPSHRRRGLGAALAERVERHAIDGGAATLTTIVENDPAGLRFVERRGFEETKANLVSSLEPRVVDVPRPEGYEVATLDELAGEEQQLYRIFGEAGGFRPGGEPSFEEWRRVILESPLLEPRGSFTVLADGRPVSLAWLLVDWERARAENEWTATVPELRGRGLARLAKLQTIRWAAENGIREVLTDNEEDNVPMLELNRSLGYRPLWRRRSFKRSV